MLAGFCFFLFQYFKDVVPCLLACIVSDNKFLQSFFLSPWIFFFSPLSLRLLLRFLSSSVLSSRHLWCVLEWFSSCLFTWVLFIFFNPCVYIFNELWKFLSPCFSSFLCFSTHSGTPHTCTSEHLILSFLSCCSVHYFLIFFPSVFVILGNFYCCVFKFANFFLQGLISF